MMNHLFNKVIKKSTVPLSFRNLHVTKNINPQLLTPGLIHFLDGLHDNHKEQYNSVLGKRKKLHDSGKYEYRLDTQEIREGDWKAANIPDNLQRRHVELTGPANDSKMVINAMNSSANAYMLDLEDSMSPLWKNVLSGHGNILPAVSGNLSYKKIQNNKLQKLYQITNEEFPTFLVRARGLHMLEHNVKDAQNSPISATLFDIGTFLYTSGKYLHDNGKGPYLYMPKMETYEDALLVNSIISQAEEKLGIPHGSTKVTALIETFPSIFQTHEIIYALKDRMVGLNCGRWDYIFSMIKCLGNKIEFPNRDLLTMDKPFMRSYVEQIVNTCHHRGIHAMGGMSAFIPTKNEDENREILDKISKDKVLEISRGCDGAWVAHPGLIGPIQKLFNDTLGSDNQVDIFNNGNELVSTESLQDLGDTIKYSDSVLRNNVSVSLQYLSAWLSGNGAVAINNMMEDLATAEISAAQLKNWIIQETKITFDISKDTYHLDSEVFDKILEEEFKNLQLTNQVQYSNRYMNTAKELLREYVNGDYKFLYQVANKQLNYDNSFEGIVFGQETLYRLGGSHKNLRGVELTKHRGEFLNRYLYEEGNDSYKFLGTSNGVSAVNVVSGGKGNVGPYAGGWQSNAMKNRLGMCLPDTLHVSPEEVANCAEEMNHHLERADHVQHIQKLDNPDFPDIVNYYDTALLADLEQGWSIPEKTRISTKKAIENGINVIHIEDQGVAKRCGHLGDKELATYDDYSVIMRSANLAAQELLGPEQSHKQWVRFVARTDAYSAKRIHNSSKLQDPNNFEHKFVDWDRGTSPDGKYLYLKEGTNPDTGRRWGLDLSIERSANIVNDGLASHVWMETPDADLHIAKTYMDEVNKILFPKGKRAHGLYNHSPSFDWDVKFFAEAKPFAEKVAEYVKNEVYQYANSLCTDPLQMNRLLTVSYRSSLEDGVREFIAKNGYEVQGDHLFSDKHINQITTHCVDYALGPNKWDDRIRHVLDSQGNSHIENEIKNLALEDRKRGFCPVDHITELIVDQRLINFSPMLASFGFDMHLITLPEFHVTAYNMHKLSDDFRTNGINAFVKNTQRPERMYSHNDKSYTYYKHQTATGTGVEASFNQAVGSADVNILDGSTEADDLKKRD
jgi:malate synthase